MAKARKLERLEKSLLRLVMNVTFCFNTKNYKKKIFYLHL